jgi:hypothetical protein
MTAARHPLAFVPRLLAAPQAAAYLGVSETKLRALPIPRRMLDGKRLYDVRALDAYADDLPIEGDAPVNGW